MSIKGQIQTTKTNDYGYTSIKVAGTWFGADKKGAISVGEGTFVEFDAFDKPGKDGKVWPSFKYATLKVSEPPAPSAAPAAQSSTYVPAKNNREDYWTQKAKEDSLKDPRITYQGSLDRAIAFADLAIRNGAFEALSKAKETKRLEVLEAFVNDVAAKIFASTYAATAPVSEIVKLSVTADGEVKAEAIDEGTWS